MLFTGHGQHCDINPRRLRLIRQNMGRQKFGIGFQTVIDTILWAQPVLSVLQPELCRLGTL
jgi:hypothetical protein